MPERGVLGREMGTGELGVCPHCGWPLEEGDDLEELRGLAGDLGIIVDLDGTVSAMDVARLLGRARPRSTWRPGACMG